MPKQRFQDIIDKLDPESNISSASDEPQVDIPENFNDPKYALTRLNLQSGRIKPEDVLKSMTEEDKNWDQAMSAGMGGMGSINKLREGTTQILPIAKGLTQKIIKPIEEKITKRIPLSNKSDTERIAALELEKNKNIQGVIKQYLSGDIDHKMTTDFIESLEREFLKLVKKLKGE